MSIKTRIVVPMVVVAFIAASTILFSTILLFSRYVESNIESELDRAMLLTSNSIEMKKNQAKFAALYVANDNMIVKSLVNMNRENLLNRVIEIYEDIALSVLVVTDRRGVVLARGQFPDVYGDDLSDRIVTKSALEGTHKAFVTRGPIIPLVIISGISVHDEQDTLVGTVIAGFRMDTDEFVDSLKELSGCEISILADGRGIATTLLDECGNRAIGEKALEKVMELMLSGQVVTGQFNLFGQEMLVRYTPLKAYDGELIGILFAGRFLAAKHEMIRSFIAIGLLILLVLLAISVPTILFVTERITAPIDKTLDLLHYDVLTGIYNRRYFEENIKRIIMSLARSGSALSLMMIDIDSFKKFNDTYGHKKGDECLKLVAQALTKSIMRADDFIARYGGEEFVVVLPNIDEIGAHFIASRMLDSVYSLNIPHAKSNAAKFVTVSIGVTFGVVEHTQSGDDYINCADEMLYASKQSGRNRYSYRKMKGSSHNHSACPAADKE